MRAIKKRMVIKRDMRQGIILFLLCSIFCASSVLASSKQPTDIEAVHFLEQASFGPTDASIAAVKQLGFSAYIDGQFAEPVTVYPILPVVYQ